jgi:hypothetical protein
MAAARDGFRGSFSGQFILVMMLRSQIQSAPQLHRLVTVSK